jgi:hypothetical protein
LLTAATVSPAQIEILLVAILFSFIETAGVGLTQIVLTVSHIPHCEDPIFSFTE